MFNLERARYKVADETQQCLREPALLSRKWSELAGGEQARRTLVAAAISVKQERLIKELRKMRQFKFWWPVAILAFAPFVVSCSSPKPATEDDVEVLELDFSGKQEFDPNAEKKEVSEDKQK